jgi:hypothetical protein
MPLAARSRAEPAWPPNLHPDIQVHPFVGSSALAVPTWRGFVPMTQALSQDTHAHSPPSDVDTVGVFSTWPLVVLGLSKPKGNTAVR